MTQYTLKLYRHRPGSNARVALGAHTFDAADGFAAIRHIQESEPEGLTDSAYAALFDQDDSLIWERGDPA